ncbi:DUF4202 domain-containing protein [Tolumonas osonensis]|uniref:DUF4202 domain-containing protein n=1 Tax=Tolumonas osonensis TaxID=675874 RepID=A0A841GFY3_9GAMM|nr:DUF4202 domain-containing protein [Tolumonas osonensis]MBB6054255.1 hypothetical protein [Tolumonas osonensis]
MSAEMISDLRFTRTIAAFDQANANDPRQEQDENGIPVAYEVLYARRMSDALLRFCPQASEALQLAARSQHIERWLLPRDHYPMDRKGYLQWRSELKLRHAARAGEIMLAEGYDAAMCERVAALLKKEKLKSDEESQMLEDVICLVFLQYYFAEFAKVHDEAKLIDILQKTWRKMSEAGHQAALSLPLPDEQKTLIAKALA